MAKSLQFWKKKVKKEQINSEVEVLEDITKDEFQKELRKKAFLLVNSLLDMGNESSDINKKARALMAYSKFRQVDSSDVTQILEMITSAGKRRLNILEKILKEKKVLEEIKSGNASLEDIYSLPKLGGEKSGH